MVRNEETLIATTYAERLANGPHWTPVAMCSTPCWRPAAPLARPCSFLVKRGADDITCICLIAAPEGIARLEELVVEAPDLVHSGARRPGRKATMRSAT
jgi:uracil phosphoribosyltransferase